jgi:hypothetical protein
MDLMDRVIVVLLLMAVYMGEILYQMVQME